MWAIDPICSLEIQIWRSYACAFPGPPKFNQASNRPKNGAKLTGMDIGEFTIYDAYLSSALINLIAITMVGGVDPPSPPQPQGF